MASRTSASASASRSSVESRTSASKLSVSKSSNSKSKTYFSNDAAQKIHKYLYYSNYEFISPDIDYPEIYRVNLFCLYKISEILKYKIDKYKKRNSPNISYSKKRGVYNISVTRKNNNNNLEKTKLITSMNTIIEFINELVKNPNMSNMSNSISTAEGLTEQIKLFLINPKLFNQKIFGNKDFKLVYNPENTIIPPDKKKKFEDIIMEDEAFQFDIIANIEEQIKEERLKYERQKDVNRSLNRLKTTLYTTNVKSISEKKAKENVKLLEEDLIKRFERLRGTMTEAELRERFERLRGTIMTEEELRERFEKLKSRSK
jgi:hypothetical protein